MFLGLFDGDLYADLSCLMNLIRMVDGGEEVGFKSNVVGFVGFWGV